jgi:hypothetical protein
VHLPESGLPLVQVRVLLVLPLALQLILDVVCWSIWTIRNKITFEKFILRSHVVIVFTVCSFLKHWAGLYGDEKEAIHAGDDQLVNKGRIW